MTTRANADLLNPMLAAAKAELDGGFMFMFAGPEPESSDEALDMASLHTQVVKYSLNNDGVTGLTFETPTDGVLAKTASEVWRGLVAFDGALSGSPSLVPTFARFCPAGDDGRDVAPGPRLQVSVGGPASNANIRLGSDSLVDNGVNTQALAAFTYVIGEDG